MVLKEVKRVSRRTIKRGGPKAAFSLIGGNSSYLLQTTLINKGHVMEFFYILTIIYHVGNVQVDIPLNSSAECDRVIRTLEHLPADLFCSNTGKLSQSIKPKLRDSLQS